MYVNELKEINVKSRIYFHWNDSININDLDLRKHLASKSGGLSICCSQYKVPYSIKGLYYILFVVKNKYIKGYDENKYLTLIPSNKYCKT